MCPLKIEFVIFLVTVGGFSLVYVFNLSQINFILRTGFAIITFIHSELPPDLSFFKQKIKCRKEKTFLTDNIITVGGEMFTKDFPPLGVIKLTPLVK